MGGESYRRRLKEMRAMDRELVGLRVENERLKIDLRDAQKDFAERVTERDQFIERLKASSSWALLRWRFFGGVIVLLLACVPSAFAQADEFPFTRSVIVNSPTDMKAWPITSAITSVKFYPGTGWIVEFDKRTGPGQWGTYITPGWNEGLQYTLGLCRKTGGYWTCSAVVEFWWNRIEEDGPKSHAPPDRIAGDWFYDSRWGELAGWQPAYGEEVGVFIAAGDCRNLAELTDGAIKQRTTARLLRWGVDLGPAATSVPTPPEPQQPPAPPDTPPTPPVVPTQPPVAQPPLDLSGVEARLSALETKVSDLAAADKKDHDDIIKAVNSPSWLGQVGKFLTSPTGMSAASALGGFLTYYLTHQQAAPATTPATTTPSTAAAAMTPSLGFAVSLR